MSVQQYSLGYAARLRRHSPLMAAAMARAMPVLPEVGSMRVSPGLMRPFSSASLIMLMAGLYSQLRIGQYFAVCHAGLV